MEHRPRLKSFGSLSGKIPSAALWHNWIREWLRIGFFKTDAQHEVQRTPRHDAVFECFQIRSPSSTCGGGLRVLASPHVYDRISGIISDMLHSSFRRSVDSRCHLHTSVPPLGLAFEHQTTNDKRKYDHCSAYMTDKPIFAFPRLSQHPHACLLPPRSLSNWMLDRMLSDDAHTLYATICCRCSTDEHYTYHMDVGHGTFCPGVAGINSPTGLSFPCL